jgi:hypothetical protein
MEPDTVCKVHSRTDATKGFGDLEHSGDAARTYRNPNPNTNVSGLGNCAASGERNLSGLNTSGSPQIAGSFNMKLETAMIREARPRTI